MRPLQDVLLHRGGNVMFVRWTNGSNIISYIKAAANAHSTAVAVANTLNLMIHHNKVQKTLLTLIGFSLGAHIVGFVGSRLKDVPHIIGDKNCRKQFKTEIFV